MSLMRRWPIVAFLIWTAYVWTTRIVNAWSAGDESTPAKAISTVVAVSLIVGVVLGITALVRARTRPFAAPEVRVFVTLAWATIVVWALRMPQIALDGDRDVPFKVVHVILGAVSIALALGAMAKAKRDAETTTVTPVGTDAPVTPVSPAAKAAR